MSTHLFVRLQVISLFHNINVLYFKDTCTQPVTPTTAQGYTYTHWSATPVCRCCRALQTHIIVLVPVNLHLMAVSNNVDQPVSWTNCVLCCWSLSLAPAVENTEAVTKSLLTVKWNPALKNKNCWSFSCTECAQKVSPQTSALIEFPQSLFSVQLKSYANGHQRRNHKSIRHCSILN